MIKIQVEAIIRKRYQTITAQINPHLPEKAPKLALTSGRRFWGKIRKRTNLKTLESNLIDIRINTPAFVDLFKRLGVEAMTEKLDETICHELAHMIHWAHTPLHTNQTKHFQAMILTAPVIALPTFTTQIAASGKAVSLADLVSNPSKARATLRKAGIAKPAGGWNWENGVPDEIKTILGL